MRAVQEFGIGDSVEYMGEVEGMRKSVVYQRSDLFILPSFSENFGVVVAEALAHGLPVITTRATPWEVLEQHKCGWWIDTGVPPLVYALRQATSSSQAELREMGLRGKEMIRRD